MNAKPLPLLLAICSTLIGTAIFARGCNRSGATAAHDNGRSQNDAGRRLPKIPPEASSSLPTKRLRKPETSAAKFVRAKLEAIIVPVVEFKDCSVEEAIDFLRLRTSELDPDAIASSRGISFHINRADDELGPDVSRIGHSLEAENISAWKLLKRIASDNRMRIDVTDRGVELTPSSAIPDPGKSLDE